MIEKAKSNNGNVKILKKSFNNRYFIRFVNFLSF